MANTSYIPILEKRFREMLLVEGSTLQNRLSFSYNFVSLRRRITKGRILVSDNFCSLRSTRAHNDAEQTQ